VRTLGVRIAAFVIAAILMAYPVVMLKLQGRPNFQQAR